MVFMNYLDNSVANNFFKEEQIQASFADFFHILHTMALYDELSDGPAWLKFQIMVKNVIGVSKLREVGLLDYLPSLIWTMVQKECHHSLPYLEQGKQMPVGEVNPIIPNLLEILYNYRRRAPISNMELLQLFQIDLWIQHKVDNDKLPEIFSKCIPDELRAQAEDAYHEYDKSLFVKEQTAIAKQLLELRVTFRENQRIKRKFRSDIKLEDQDKIIQLVSADKFAQTR